jgi:guanylate kinase
LWKQTTDPDLLIFLDASYPETIKRRHLNWSPEEYQEQHRRLSHARQNADFYLLTDEMAPDEVLSMVLGFLNAQNTAK